MDPLYSEIKSLHVTCVVLSGSLFALRGLMMIRGLPNSFHPTLRYSSYIIDTTLLGAAVALTVLRQQYPFVHAWLTVKVISLVVYIALGMLALRPGRTGRTRTVFFVAALFVYGFIISVALTHDALGIFRGDFG